MSYKNNVRLYIIASLYRYDLQYLIQISFVSTDHDLLKPKSRVMFLNYMYIIYTFISTRRFVHEFTGYIQFFLMRHNRHIIENRSCFFHIVYSVFIIFVILSISTSTLISSLQLFICLSPGHRCFAQHNMCPLILISFFLQRNIGYAIVFLFKLLCPYVLFFSFELACRMFGCIMNK